MNDLGNKVLLISGSTGIAEATAVAAVERGAKVFVTSRTEANCAALAERLGDNGGYVAADLAEDEAGDRVVAACLERFRRIDGLFNVAGISGRRFGDGPLHECTPEGWDVTMATNVRTQYLLSRPVLNHMLERELDDVSGRGAILNMASVLGFAPDGTHFATHAYAASKGAILGMTKAMAAFYAPQKIRVNAIAPALVRTPMSQRAQQDEKILEYMRSKQPLTEGMIDAEDVAQTALFLLGDGARSITGDVVTVDAGWCVS